MLTNLWATLTESADLTKVYTAITGVDSIVRIVFALIVSTVLGLAIAAVYRRTYAGAVYSQSFAVSLVIITVVLASVITVVESNFAWALSLGGVLSLVRFRASMRDPKDVAFVALAAAVGLCCGAGGYGAIIGAIVTVMVCIVLLILGATDAFSPVSAHRRLRIRIPEDLNYDGVFEPILDKYCTKYSLRKVSSVDLGTLFELVFEVSMKNEADAKAMLDEIRCFNSNLNVSLINAATEFNEK